MQRDPTLDYNVRIVEGHLKVCETCTDVLRRQPTTQEKLDKRMMEGEQLTEDEVHRIVSLPEAENDTKALPADE